MKRKTRMFLTEVFERVLLSLISLAFISPMTELRAQDKTLLNSQIVYSISDLEVLQQANAYNEFFKHAHDILPTKRSKYWLDMVSNMAQAYIDDSSKQDKFELSTFQSIEALSSWPELRGDEFFQIKRSRFAINYFKVCLSTQKVSPCKAQMLSFWKSARKDAETGFQLLQYFAGFFPRHDNWPLLKSILTKPAGKFYCARPLVSSLTFAHLEKQHLYNETNNKVKLYLSQMSTQDCWKQMSEQAKSALQQMPTSQTRSLFISLEATNLISMTQRSTWLVRYYLSAPTTGSLLNRAWSQLDTLANNFTQRKKVLQELLKLDPLPGDLFENLARKKNLTLFEHFTQNFPEYIQEYSKTCIAYREGTKLFPRGNPTIQCRKLMSHDSRLKRKKISQEVHIRYSGTLKGLPKKR